MVNNLVVYSLSCQPSRWIYQPCKASVPGLQLLLIRLARTRIRLAFARVSGWLFSVSAVFLIDNDNCGAR